MVVSRTTYFKHNSIISTTPYYLCLLFIFQSNFLFAAHTIPAFLAVLLEFEIRDLVNRTATMKTKSSHHIFDLFHYFRKRESPIVDVSLGLKKLFSHFFLVYYRLNLLKVIDARKTFIDFRWMKMAGNQVFH